MKPSLTRETAKPCATTVEVAGTPIPTLNTFTNVSNHTILANVEARNTNGYRKISGRGWNSYLFIILALLVFISACSWVSVYLILNLTVSQFKALNRIEEKLAALELDGQDQDPVGPRSTTGVTSGLTEITEYRTSATDTTESSTSTAREYSTSITTTVDPMSICTVPTFQDLQPEPIKGTTEGHAYEYPLGVLKNADNNKRKKTFECRKACNHPEYHQVKLIYEYRTNATAQFEAFGTTEKEAQFSVCYEALKCIYPNKTLKSGIVVSEDWYAPGDEPDCLEQANSNYRACFK